jgi:hypothetical protein
MLRENCKREEIKGATESFIKRGFVIGISTKNYYGNK